MGCGIEVGLAVRRGLVMEVEMRRGMQRDHPALVIDLVGNAGTVERPAERARQHRDEQRKDDGTVSGIAHGGNYACRRPSAQPSLPGDTTPYGAAEAVDLVPQWLPYEMGSI